MFLASEVPGRRPRVLSEEHEQELLEYLDKRPMVYLDEMAYFLLDELDLRVIEATVFRVLRRLRCSRKQYRRVARESNYVLKVGRDA